MHLHLVCYEIFDVKLLNIYVCAIMEGFCFVEYLQVISQQCDTGVAGSGDGAG